MPYTSRRLIEYNSYWRSELPAPSLGPCSPTASESGLHDAFTDHVGSSSKDRRDDGTERGEAPADIAPPVLKLYDFAKEKPRRPEISCGLNNQDGGWDNITQDIITICCNTFKDTTWDDLDEPLRIEFTRIAPDARRLMGIPYGNIHLFAAKIWRILDEAIFQKVKTDSIQWGSPYFKYQNDMLQELRKRKPDAPHSYMTRVWNEWDHHSVSLFEGTTTGWTNRIRPECFQQVIADGIGPLFPKTLDVDSVGTLRRLASLLLYWEKVFSCCKDYHYFLFGHPGTLKTSGFTFRKKLSGSPAMKGFYDRCMDDGNTFEGRRVDLVVSPMVMTVKFKYFDQPDFIRIPRMDVPMAVCAGWIEDLDNEKQSESMSGIGSYETDSSDADNSDQMEEEDRETDSGNADDPEQMEDKVGETDSGNADDPEQMEDEDDLGNVGDFDQMEDEEGEIPSNTGLEKTSPGNAEDPDRMGDEEGENASNAGLDETDSGNAKDPDQTEDEDGETVSGSTNNPDQMKDKRGERTGEARPGNAEEPERRTKKSKP